MHDKVILVDGSTVETGSFNYTAAAERNAENVLVLHDAVVSASASRARIAGLGERTYKIGK